MSKIDINRLQLAQRELGSISERRAGPFKNKDIDWQVIRGALGNLETALKNGNRAEFDAALGKLRTRLAAPLKLRGKIHAYSQNMPTRVEDLLNQTIDQIHNELTTPTVELPSERADKDDAAKDKSEGQN